MNRTDLGAALEFARYAAARARAEPTLMTFGVAVQAWTSALAVARASEHPNQLHIATELAYCLEDRFLLSRDLADLDEAIEIYAALSNSGPYDDRDACWAALGQAAMRRYGSTADVADLELAMSAFECSASGGQLSIAAAESCQQNWALACYQRAVALDDLAGLGEAIAALRALGAATDLGVRATARSNLGIALHAQYKVTLDPRDLDDAVQAQDEALAMLDPASPDRPRWLMNLGNALTSLSRRAGDTDAIDRAIAALRASVQLMGPRQERAVALVNLAEALRLRSDTLGSEADNDEALSIYEEVLRVTARGTRARAIAAGGLARLLCRRFQLSGDEQDLDTAGALAGSVLADAAEGSPGQVSALVLAGQTARLRAAVSAGDPDTAIDLPARAERLAPEGSELWCTARGALGEALLTKYKVRGDHADLDAAVDALGSALRRAPEGTGLAADLSASLAECLDLRYDAPPGPASRPPGPAHANHAVGGNA